MPMFYFLFKLVDTSFFASESILIIFNQPQIDPISGASTMIISQDTWIIVLVAYVLMLLFIGVNAFSTKAAKIISVIASVAKFLPLIVVGILGITFGAING
jgi:amino acid transporter